MPSVADPYAKLSPAARLVAQAYGVVAPHAMRLQRTQNLLATANVKLSGQALTAKEIETSHTELTRAKLLERDKFAFSAAPEWALPLTRIAHEERHLEPLLRAYEAIQAKEWHQPVEDTALLRGYLVAGNEARVNDLADDDYGDLDWSFLAEPLAEDLLARVAQRHRDDALAACLDRVIHVAAPADPVIDVCLKLSAAPWRHAPNIAFVRVLQGRFDDAQETFAEFPPSRLEASDARLVSSAAAATQALIALLAGDDAVAQQHVDRAERMEKTGTRKRLVFPPLRAFALALLTMVRRDTPAARRRLDELLHAARRLEVLNHEIVFVENALRVKDKIGVFARTPGEPSLPALFDGLLCCWMDDFNPRRRERRDLLLPYRDRAAANGYDWVAAECDEVLRRYAARYGGKGPKPGRKLADLGAATLTTLATPTPDWEVSLRVLEQLAFAKSKARAKGQGAGRKPKRRLAWTYLGGESPYSGLLEAREQRQQKNGAWSKGRKIATQRLVAEGGAMDFLLPQDRDAIAAFGTYKYWGGHQEHYFGRRSLYALAGHPYVYNEDGDPVEVVRREPELSVDEADDGSVLARIDPYPGEEDGDYRIKPINAGRCEVTHFKPEHQHLFDAIPEEGLALPAAARQRLLEAAAGLAADIRVQSTADGEVGAAEVQADSAPWVRLEPLDAGLNVAVMVEPIPNSGICFEPGVGGTTLFANVHGENVQTRRDLDVERLLADELGGRVPQLTPRPSESAPLTLPKPLQCLDLLDRLNAAEARCKWPKGEAFRIVGQAAAPALGLSVKSAGEWFQASGQLAIDERRVLELKRLFALLEESPGERFLALGDGEFVALTDAFRRQLDDLRALATPAAKGEMRINALAALALDDLLEEASIDADEGWAKLRNRLQAAQAYEPELPSTLQAELRPYQVEGYRWLARLSRWGAGACLADDMGLGKTVQTLAVLLERAPGGPALVIAPTSVIANWQDEARRFAPTLNVKRYAGFIPSREALLKEPAPFDLFLVTYGVLQNDIEQLSAIEWHSAVLDEAQAVKNPAAKRSRAVKALRAAFRVITTGTPIQNNLIDLHSLFGFVNPGLLGSLAQFRANFAAPIERDADAWTQGRLRRLIAPFLLRRLKADVLDDLPERTEIILHVEMSSEEAALYEALRQRAVEELEGARRDGPELAEGARRVQVLAHLTRLRLACCNPRLVTDAKRAPPSAKLATFATTLEELLANRHKVLVFSQFVKHLQLVEEHLRSAGVGYQYLDGSTPAKARAERINAFQAGQGDVFLISLKAGGVGLNLTAADYVIHMDPWWNPAVEDQASDRAHRIGQTRPVTIYRLVTVGTIEEQIVDLHHRKRDLADQLLEGADAPGRLNAEELLELLRQPLREAL